MPSRRLRRRVFAWEWKTTGSLAGNKKARPTRQEVMFFLEAYPAVRASAKKMGATGRNATLLGGRGFLSFIHFALWMQNNDKADESSWIIFSPVPIWMKAIRSSTPAIASPLIAVCGAMRKAELLFKAWNLWRKGEKVTRQIQLTGKLPELVA